MKETETIDPGREYDYRSEQCKILEGLRVGRLEPTLPSHLLDVYRENQDIVGERRLKYDKNQILVTADNNGIFTIRELKRIRTGFLSFHPNLREVENFYYIDAINYKAWDVSQLWREYQKEKFSKLGEEGKRGKFRLYHYYREGGEESSKFGHNVALRIGVIELNRVLDNPSVKKMKYPSSRIKRAMDQVAPAHEAAHFTQVDPELLEKSKWELIKMSLERKFYSTIVKSKLVTRVSSVIPGIRKGLEGYRQIKVEKERNANAFALATIRRLKEQGLDVFRGVPYRDIILAVNYALHTYDDYFSAVGGQKFSKVEADLGSKKGREEAFHEKRGVSDTKQTSRSLFLEPV